jgi:hypothetical protein
MHMAKSEYLFFMFDPTQHPKFREKLAGGTDPQLDPEWHIRRQDICFNEAARRIRRHVGVPHGTKYRKPVVVVVNKFDIWKGLFPMQVDPEPFISDRKSAVHGVATGYVEDVSFSLRALMIDICPEIVSAVEDFAERVTYIPVSTIGHSPERGEKGELLVRPGSIRPFWVAIPFLYAFARLGLIYRGDRPIPPGTPTATLLRHVNGLLYCKLKDGSELEISERLAGKMLHHPRTTQPFVVPKPARGLSGH